MDTQEFNSMARGYVAGNVIAKTASQNLQKIIDEAQEWKSHHPDINEINATVAKLILQSKQAEGAEYLNNLIMEEFIHFTQHQDKLTMPLPEMIENIKNKYTPCYSRLRISMPTNLKDIKAEELCEMLGVQILSNAEKIAKQRASQEDPNNLTPFIIIAIVVIVCIFVFCFAMYA